MRCYRFGRGREARRQQGVFSEITVDQKPPAGSFGQLSSTIRQWSSGIGECLKFVDQPKTGGKGIAGEPLGIEGVLQRRPYRLKIYFPNGFAIFFHPNRRKAKCRWRGETFQFSSLL